MKKIKPLIVVFIIFIFSVTSFAQNVLVVAPHPDDEIIGPGASIYRHLQQGDKVKVIMMTRGEGFFWARKLFSKQLFTDLKELVAFGGVREKETLNALQKLGVNKSQVGLIGFPDGYLNEVLLTGKFFSYTREELLTYFENTIEEFKPDLIYLPHMLDEHKDHWATAVLVNLALLRTDYTITQYQYLVHLNDYPQPRKFNSKLNLLPPDELKNNLNWVRKKLSKREINKKLAAIGQFKTQFITKKYLYSFIRQNELFTKAKPVLIPKTGENIRNFEAVILKETQLINKTVLDPELNKGDIIKISVYNTPKTLYICIQFRNRPTDHLDFYLIGPDNKKLINKFTYLKKEKNNNWSRINNRLYLRINKEITNKQQIIGAISYHRNQVVDNSGWFNIIIK